MKKIMLSKTKQDKNNKNSVIALHFHVFLMSD